MPTKTFMVQVDEENINKVLSAIYINPKDVTACDLIRYLLNLGIHQKAEALKKVLNPCFAVTELKVEEPKADDPNLPDLVPVTISVPKQLYGQIKYLSNAFVDRNGSDNGYLCLCLEIGSREIIKNERINIVLGEITRNSRALAEQLGDLSKQRKPRN